MRWPDQEIFLSLWLLLFRFVPLSFQAPDSQNTWVKRVINGTHKDDTGFETVEIEVSGLRKGGESLTCLSIIFYAKIEALIELLLERRVIKKDDL